MLFAVFVEHQLVCHGTDYLETGKLCHTMCLHYVRVTQKTCHVIITEVSETISLACH